MSDVHVTLSGMDAVFATIDKNYIKQAGRVNRAVHSAGLTCQKVAKQHCPVGTPESTGIKGYHGGRLRASIQVNNRVSSIGGGKFIESTVGTNVYYGIFVEKGTVKMRARPFLTLGFDEGAYQLMEDLSSNIDAGGIEGFIDL